MGLAGSSTAFGQVQGSGQQQLGSGPELSSFHAPLFDDGAHQRQGAFQPLGLPGMPGLQVCSPLPWSVQALWLSACTTICTVAPHRQLEQNGLSCPLRRWRSAAARRLPATGAAGNARPAGAAAPPADGLRTSGAWPVACSHAQSLWDSLHTHAVCRFAVCRFSSPPAFRYSQAATEQELYQPLGLPGLSLEFASCSYVREPLSASSLTAMHQSPELWLLAPSACLR